MIKPFETLPDSARLWIYVASDSLGAGETELVRRTKTFISGWTSHTLPVGGDAFVAEGRFLVIGAHVVDGDLSGCGIDASVREITRLAEELGIRWADGLVVAFRGASGGVEVVNRPQFRARSRTGEIGAETFVFDTGLTCVGDWRAGYFEKAARDSWHAGVFGLTRAA